MKFNDSDEDKTSLEEGMRETQAASETKNESRQNDMKNRVDYIFTKLQ